MESTTAPLARTAPTHGLAELVQRPGPFLTAVVETEGAIDNAAQRTAQRWNAQRDAALAAGVPEAALGAVPELLPDAHHEGPALFVVADGERGEPLLVEHLASMPDAASFTRFAPLPSLVPLLADRQTRLPHVVVRCDREGADILAVDADGRHTEDHVTDDDRPYRHARSVGWRELAGWHRARRHIARTADETAAAVAEAAHRIGASLVLVAGDDRTVDQVVERCAARDHGLDARAVAGGRGHDGSDEHVDEAVRTLVRTAAAEHTVAALQRFREQRAHGLAVEGYRGVREALAEAKVDVLLVHDDGRDDRAVDEVVRHALEQSSGIVVLPTHAGPEEAVGALLRWR